MKKISDFLDRYLFMVIVSTFAIFLFVTDNVYSGKVFLAMGFGYTYAFVEEKLLKLIDKFLNFIKSKVSKK